MASPTKHSLAECLVFIDAKKLLLSFPDLPNYNRDPKVCKVSIKSPKARYFVAIPQDSIINFPSLNQKKLEKIMALISTKEKISNDDIEKLLHVSDATVTRYLDTLKKQGRIQQVGKTGKAVFYTKA